MMLWITLQSLYWSLFFVRRLEYLQIVHFKRRSLQLLSSKLTPNLCKLPELTPPDFMEYIEQLLSQNHALKKVIAKEYESYYETLWLNGYYL